MARPGVNATLCLDGESDHGIQAESLDFDSNAQKGDPTTYHGLGADRMNRHHLSMTRRQGVWALACLLLPVMMLTAGCRNNPVLAVSDDNRVLQRGKDGILVANPQSPLPDVPAPVGFELIPAKSFGRINPGGTREVRHVYQGLADFSAAIEYYRRQAATHGWQSIHQLADGQETVLTYQSPRETLEVRLSKPYRIVTVTVVIRSREYGITTYQRDTP